MCSPIVVEIETPISKKDQKRMRRNSKRSSQGSSNSSEMDSSKLPERRLSVSGETTSFSTTTTTTTKMVGLIQVRSKLKN